MEQALSIQTLRILRRILLASERSTRQIASSVSMTPSQLLLLQEVQRLGETTPTAIANMLGFGQATVTNIVDRLVSAGLLTRTRADSDRRRILLHITEAGGDTLDAAPDSIQNRFNENFVLLPTWEQAMILASLERLADLLQATDLDAAPLIDAGKIDREAD